MHPRTFLALGVVATLGATGCAASDAPDNGSAEVPGRIKVAAAFQPIEEIARRVGGDRISVIDLTPPGAEAHEVELTAQQLEELASARAVAYLGDGFQPSVESSIAALDQGITKIDLLDGLDLLADPDAETSTGVDPHVWLSPINMVAMTRQFADALGAIDPANATAYDAASEAYVSELTALDTELSTGLASCSTTTFVTNHRAFGYLADRYGLTQVAISGISPESEPSAQELEAVAAEATSAGVSVIFVEANIGRSLADTLADELGLSTRVLQTVESFSDEQLAAGATYLSAQRENLAALAEGLGCSAS